MSWNISELNRGAIRGVPVTPVKAEVIGAMLERYHLPWEALPGGRFVVFNKRHALEFASLADVARWVDYWCLGIGTEQTA